MEFCKSSAGSAEFCGRKASLYAVSLCSGDLFEVERLGVWQGRVSGFRRFTTVSSFKFKFKFQVERIWG